MKNFHRYRAFTLVETLVAVVLIGILVALLLPTLRASYRQAQTAAIAAEIQGFNQGLASFTNRFSYYPPSHLICSESGDYSATNLSGLSAFDQAKVNRTLFVLRTFWPRILLTTQGTSPYASGTITGIGWYDFNGNGIYDASPYVLSGDECLPFFLGGIPQPSTGQNGDTKFGMSGFCDDPRNPFQPFSYTNATTGLLVTPNRKLPNVEFKVGQLVDSDGDGIPAYGDLSNGSNFFTPYAYFSTTATSYDPSDVDFATEPNGDPSPVGSFGGISSAAPNPYTVGPALSVNGSYAAGTLATSQAPVQWWNNRGGYQIISAGMDRQFGPGGWYDSNPKNASAIPFPATANTAATGVALQPDARFCERDNVTNFSSGAFGP